MRRVRSMGGLTLLLSLVVVPTMAAELIGVVTANGKPLPKRKVCLVGVASTETGKTETSDKDGWFKFKDVPVPGNGAEFFLSCPAQEPDCTAKDKTAKQHVRLGPGTNNINCRQ